MREAYRTAFSGRAAQWAHEGPDGLRRLYAGQVRAFDLTYGEANGWHPHYHSVMFFDPSTTEDQRQAYLRRARDRYIVALKKAGRNASASSIGWDVRQITTNNDISSYLAKVEGGWGAGLELTRSDLKKSHGGRTAWDLLRAASEDGDMDASRLWWEYEAATKGKALVQVGNGLAKRFHVPELELSDEDLAAKEMEELPVYVSVFSASEWSWLVVEGLACTAIEVAVERALAIAPPPPIAELLAVPERERKVL